MNEGLSVLKGEGGHVLIKTLTGKTYKVPANFSSTVNSLKEGL